MLKIIKKCSFFLMVIFLPIIQPVFAYRITYDLNGGQLPNGDTNYSTETNGNEVVLDNPVWENHIFGGWCEKTDYETNNGVCASPIGVSGGTAVWTVPSTINSDTDYIAIWNTCPDIPLASAQNNYTMSNKYKDYGAMNPSLYRFTYDFDNDGVTVNDCVTMVIKAQYPEYLETNPTSANILGIDFCRYNGTDYSNCAEPLALCYMPALNLANSASTTFSYYLSYYRSKLNREPRFIWSAANLHTGRCRGCPQAVSIFGEGYNIELSNNWYAVSQAVTDMDDNGETQDECLSMVVKSNNPSALLEGNYADAEITDVSICRYNTQTQMYDKCSISVIPCSLEDWQSILQLASEMWNIDDHEAACQLHEYLARLMYGNNATLSDVDFIYPSNTIPNSNNCSANPLSFVCMTDVWLNIASEQMCLVDISNKSEHSLVARQGGNKYYVNLVEKTEQDNAVPIHKNSTVNVKVKAFDSTQNRNVLYYAHDVSVSE